MKKVGILTNQLYSWNDTDVLAVGGGEKVTLMLANLLDKLNYEVHIYQRSPRPFSTHIENICVHGIQNTLSVCNCFNAGVCNEFYKLTKDFDKVLICLPEMCGGDMREDAILITQGIFWCSQEGKNLSEERKKYLYDAWNGAGTNVVVHPYTVDAIRELGFNEIADGIICIDNCVDTEIFTPAVKEKIILFPGRAEIAKGTDNIESILKEIDLPNWKIIWCGAGSQFNIIKKLENKYENFTATSLPMDEVHKTYATASICVVMNTVSKGNSLTLMEGMASECACIGIDGGTTLIDNGENGVLCKIDEIAKTIKNLTENPTLCKFTGKQARLDMISRHSVAKWENEWIEVIGE